MDPKAVLDDLQAEGDELEALVRPIAPQSWAVATPAEGWTIAHQIAHLAWTDQQSLTAATDADAFGEILAEAAAKVEAFVDEGAETGAAEPPEALLERWCAGRRELQRVLAAQPVGVRLPWFGPPMSVASMATARLMETWAHGLDIADALGVRPKPSARLRNVVHLGVRTRDFAYAIHGRTPPAEEFRIELTGPGGELWAYGPMDAPQRVSGSALDFCLLVTQRIHRADADLKAQGPDAAEWLDITQAFAGPPGAGRAARRAARA